MLQEVDFNWNTLNLAIWACNIKSVDYWLELELCIKRVISGQTDISHKIFNSSARLMQFFFYFLHDFCKYMYLVNVKRFYKREEGEGVNFFMVGVGLFLIMLIFECCTVIQYFPVFIQFGNCVQIFHNFIKEKFKLSVTLLFFVCLSGKATDWHWWPTVNL